MIYFTSLIFTLLLAHIARAVPACDDVASSQVAYDDTEQLVLNTYKVTFDPVYDNRSGSTDSVACSNGPHGLASKYPKFKDFPDFPYLGGAFDVKWGSPNCGKCWKLTDKKSKRFIYFTAIDHTASGFNIGKKAFIALGGSVAAGSLEAEAIKVSDHFCGFK